MAGQVLGGTGSRPLRKDCKETQLDQLQDISRTENWTLAVRHAVASPPRVILLLCFRGATPCAAPSLRGRVTDTPRTYTSQSQTCG